MCMHACVCSMHVCVAKPVAVELRCHATALIIYDTEFPAFYFEQGEVIMPA